MCQGVTPGNQVCYAKNMREKNKNKNVNFQINPQTENMSRRDRL